MSIVSPMNPADNNAPVVPKSEAAQERELLDEPLSANYKPRLPLSVMWGDDSLPPMWEVLRRVEAMAYHPIVAIAMNYYRAGIYPAEFEVRASSSEAGTLGLSMIRRFWSRDLHIAQLCYEYGWAGFEVCYEEKNRYLIYKGLLEFSPIDVQVLTQNKKYIGVRAHAGSGDGKTLNLWGGRKRLPAKGLWLTHKKKYHRWHGRTQYYSAYKPWWEMAARDGSEEVICMAMYRFGCPGPTIRHPQGSENAKRTRPGENRQDYRDLALQYGEAAKSGVTTVLPNTRDDKGNFLWDVQWPQHAFDGQGLINFDDAWTKKIFFGMEIAPEVIQASDTGSGYSGRSIPKEAFYVGQQNNANEIILPFVEQVVNPTIRWNLGPHEWIEVTVKPLLKSQAQQAAGQQGGDQSAGGQMGGAPGQPGQQPAQQPGKSAQGAVPDLSAIFGQGGGQPKTQNMATMIDGVQWLGHNRSVENSFGGSDTVWLPADASKPIRMIRAPKQPKAVNTQTLALPPVAGAQTIAGDIEVAKPTTVIEEIGYDAGRGYKRLLERIRKEILASFKTGDPNVVAAKIESILVKNQPALAKLLADTRFAAALAGAWDIIKGHPEEKIGILPPSGTGILARILAERPAAEAAAVREAIAIPETPPEQPEFEWRPKIGANEPSPIVTFPVIEEAAKDLMAREAMTRADFDAMDAENRSGAFTVAGLATAAAIEKVRDAAAKAVQAGQNMGQFEKNVSDELGEGTFLSPQHMETVFRVGVMSAYANGQDRVLSDPRVGDYFPYVMRNAIHDPPRVRPEHLAMEKYGIQGTNIYRADDPVYRKFRAPWGYNCRCNDTYLTLAQAAEKGIQEAIEWQRTGQAPTEPAYVAHPPFEPDPGWQRLGLDLIGVQWMDAQHAPAGGGTYGGKFFPGGRFIPKEYLDAATAEEKATLGGGGQQPPAAKPAPIKADTVVAEPKEEVDDKPKFASTQFNLADAEFPHYQPSPLPKLVQFATEIPTTHLADKGRETNFHVTVLYGLHDNEARQVAGAVREFGPVKMKLGPISIFPASGNHEFDVIKIDVESDDLHRLHDQLAKLPHTSKYPIYRPHLTIAYVRPGLGNQYIGDKSFDGVEFICKNLTFSDRQKRTFDIDLTAAKPAEVQQLSAFRGLGIVL